jgi:hypothetical protein
MRRSRPFESASLVARMKVNRVRMPKLRAPLVSDKRDQSSPVQTIGGEMDSRTVSTQETLGSESLPV